MFCLLFKNVRFQKSMSFNDNLNRRNFGANDIVVKTEKCDDAQRQFNSSSQTSRADKRKAETGKAAVSGEQRPGPPKRPRMPSTSARSSVAPPSRIATPASNSAVASAEQLSKKLAALKRALSTPPVDNRKTPDRSHPKRAKSVGPKKQAYRFEPDIPANHEPLTPDEKAELRSKIDEFGYYGILDMSSIIYKHEEGIMIKAYKSECLLEHFDNLRPVTLREIDAYIKVTQNKRKRRPKNDAALRSFSNPPVSRERSASVVSRGRAKSVTRGKKPAYYFDANDPANKVDMSAEEKAELRRKIFEFSYYGIVDMSKIIHAHETTVRLTNMSTDLLLNIFPDLRTVTLREIAAYIQATPPPTKRKPKYRNPQNQAVTAPQRVVENIHVEPQANENPTRERQIDAQPSKTLHDLLEDVKLSDSDGPMSDSGANAAFKPKVSDAFDGVELSSYSDDPMSNPAPTSRIPTPPPNDMAAPTVPPKQASKPSLSRASTPGAPKTAPNRDRAPSKPRSRKPATQPYVFNPEDPRNHEDMTGPEKDALCRNINEFMKSGVDDMIKIIGKYDKELQPMLVNAKSIICYFQMIRTVTLRELEAYMESTPNKRKLKFRQKAIEEHEQLSINSRALSVPPGGKTNAVNQNRAKSVGPTKKQACLCGANHASDEHPLSSLEMRYLRDTIIEYGRDGILDMTKIIHKHELHIPVMRPTSEALLQHLEKLRPKTLREIAEYIFATPNKRIAVVVQPENFYIMPEADAPTSPYDYPMDDIIELVETSIPLASDLSKCRPHIVKDATPEEVQTTKLPQKAPETAVDEVFVVQPENFYVMPEADAPTSPYDFPMDDVIESAETSIPLASDSLEEESTPERQFEKPVYEFDLDDVRSFETMTFEQKHALSRKVDKLCAHGKNDLIEIVDKHEGHPGAKERLVDFNQLRSVTLREIEAYFNAMPDDWKSKCEPRKAKASKSKKQMDKTAAGNPGIKKHYLFESSTSDSENPKDASSESNSSHGSDDSCDSSSSESDDESETATVTPALSHAPLLTTHSPAPTTKTVSSTKRARSPWNMDVEVPPFSETYFEDDF